MLNLLAGVIIYLLLANTGSAASFDCGEAKGHPERLICSDSELSMLDEYLGRYYYAAMKELGEGSACLRADQRQWLQTVRNECRDRSCLRDIYRERLGELDPFQPGVTAIKAPELPGGRRSLVWIAPPAADETMVSSAAEGKPLAVSGTLINEIDKGDGISIRTRKNESYLIIQLMLADEASVDRLIQLAEDENAFYTAQGSAAVDEAGKYYFDPRQCVYIYRAR